MDAMPGIFIAAIKLALGLLAFLIVGYVGRLYDKRIAGALLTFPILNAIGILSGSDPLAVANSIYVVVIVNGALFYFVISYSQFLPPLPQSAKSELHLFARLVVWTILWMPPAVIVTELRDRLPGPAALLALQLAACAYLMWRNWTPAPAPRASSRPGAWRGHVVGLAAFWVNRSGMVRILLFVICFGIILAVADLSSSRWIGTVSALPLPGLFALALLSVLEAGPAALHPIRDTVLIGPVLVIVFNWAFVQVVLHLPSQEPQRLALGFAAAIAGWALTAIAIFCGVPRLARALDRKTGAAPD